jgi:hypothetical protein
MEETGGHFHTKDRGDNMLGQVEAINPIIFFIELLIQERSGPGAHSQALNLVQLVCCIMN